MNLADAQAELDRIRSETPDATDVVLFTRTEHRKRQVESEGQLRLSIQRSQKETLVELLERIGARIGSQRISDRLDWLMALGFQELDKGQEELPHGT